MTSEVNAMERTGTKTGGVGELTIGTIVPAAMLEVLLERAARFPRNEQLALESAMEELRRVPALAAKSYYSIPYEDRDTGTKKPVEGLSIGSSMAMTRRWGNMITGGLLTAEDEKGWDMMGICLDLESLAYNSRPYRSSKFYKPKGSQSMVPLIGQQKENKLLAGISKAIRTAALWTLPEWFKDAYFTEAKLIVLQPPAAMGKAVKSIQERLLDARAVFAKNWKVSDKEMSDYIEGLSNVEDPNALLIHLQGLFNGIEEGRTNADEVFGRVKQAAYMPTEKAPAPETAAESK